MPDGLRLYLDQMFRVDVARAITRAGYDVIRASEVGQARADDQEILEKAISENVRQGDVVHLIQKLLHRPGRGYFPS